MSVQDDKAADQEDTTAEHDDKAADQDDDQRVTEKPEPDEDDKQKAAEMMEAYKEKPTIVLPGTGGSVSGTAVNDWLDEDGNPRHQEPEGGQGKADDAEQSRGDDAAQSGEDGTRDEQELQDQIEKDKALNEELKKAAAAENKGEKD
ncbi:hypothetical protein A5714_22930 [Mycobacterium sp. E2462]|uniref:hypothetical protein n=1 Tax=Mycobacterium sp. E2462 TaxID=1834133 RepID=UPI0008020F32|nr:hypothetical protein [Mycobacterium sp. E2462]OBI06948.1 hypothetical protein A5714_22930 [Mycobacterium sp. E2462]